MPSSPVRKTVHRIRSAAVAFCAAAVLGADTVQFGAAISPAAFDASTAAYVISDDRMLQPLLAWFFPETANPAVADTSTGTKSAREVPHPCTTADGLFDESLLEVPASDEGTEPESVSAAIGVSTVAAVSLNPTLARDVVRSISAAGFGKLELIRLILISEAASPGPADLRRLAEQRARGMSLRDIAARAGVSDYDHAVWRESRRIYELIYRSPPP